MRTINLALAVCFALLLFDTDPARAGDAGGLQAGTDALGRQGDFKDGCLRSTSREAI